MRVGVRASVVGIGLLWLPLASQAYEISDVQVQHVRDRYEIGFDVRLAAEPAAVRRLLTDYARLSQLSGTVIDSRVLAHNTHRTRIALTLRACILWMCRNISQVEDVRVASDGTIEGSVVPAQSDFQSLQEKWRIRADGEGTRVRYDATMVPKFFVPPLVGPWLIRMKMRDELKSSAARLEALAAQSP